MPIEKPVMNLIVEVAQLHAQNSYEHRVNAPGTDALEATFGPQRRDAETKVDKVLDRHLQAANAQGLFDKLPSELRVKITSDFAKRLAQGAAIEYTQGRDVDAFVAAAIPAADARGFMPAATERVRAVSEPVQR